LRVSQLFVLITTVYFVQGGWVAKVLSGNATYSGAFAAIMANVVLFAYIIVAMREDQTDKIEAEEKRKKAQ
jgi:hypothetical protein